LILLSCLPSFPVPHRSTSKQAQGNLEAKSSRKLKKPSFPFSFSLFNSASFLFNHSRLLFYHIVPISIFFFHVIELLLHIRLIYIRLLANLTYWNLDIGRQKISFFWFCCVLTLLFISLYLINPMRKILITQADKPCRAQGALSSRIIIPASLG